ncbi:hypothetical protein MUP95_00300, partial [bacterium]|nr:hypothetical protein [bacterium]
MQPQYILTMAVNESGWGTTTPTVGDHLYDKDEVVAITAAPTAGYQFVNWTGDVEDPNSANTTVTMNGNKTITANFQIQTPQEAYLWSIRSDGTGLKRMSNFISWSPNVWMPPIFSPDGSKVVFIKEYASEGRSEIWKVNTDGSGLLQLTDPGPQPEGHEWPFDWSSDGNMITFRSDRSNHNGGFDVWTMNSDGTNQQNWGESNGP